MVSGPQSLAAAFSKREATGMATASRTVAATTTVSKKISGICRLMGVRAGFALPVPRATQLFTPCLPCGRVAPRRGV